MKHFLFSLFFLAPVCSLSAQSWTMLPSATAYAIQDVWAQPQQDDTAVVCGAYVQAGDVLPFALRTTNGGMTMTTSDVYFGGTFAGAYGMDFVDGNTGYMCGGGVLATYNGGQGWGQLLDVFEVYGTLYDFHAASFDDLYTAGESFAGEGMAMVSHDAGQSWASSTITDGITNVNTTITSVVRATGNRLYAGAAASGSGSPTLFLSTDDGLTWTALNFIHGVNGLWASIGDAIFAATDFGIYRISDAGASIVPKQLTSVPVTGLDIKQALGFAVCADGSIYTSADGGNNWSLMTSPVQGTRLNSVRFANDQVAYACGDSGTLLRWDAMSTGVEPITSGTMHLAPNPATDVLRVQASAASVYDLFDARGERVASGRLVVGTNVIPVLGLPAGLYFLHSGGSAQRFLKE